MSTVGAAVKHVVTAPEYLPDEMTVAFLKFMERLVETWESKEDDLTKEGLVELDTTRATIHFSHIGAEVTIHVSGIADVKAEED